MERISLIFPENETGLLSSRLFSHFQFLKPFLIYLTRAYMPT